MGRARETFLAKKVSPEKLSSFPGSAPFPTSFPTRLIGREVLYYPRLPSTMDEARRLAQEGAKEGTVVVAGEQTAGRGRYGRRWCSPQGALALSVVLRPTLPLLPGIGMAAPLAVVYALKRGWGVAAGLKWPNDVLLKGKKLAGILVESGVRGGEVDFAILGIGLNVNLDPQAFPEIAQTATSLSMEIGREISPWDALPLLLEELDRLYLALKAGEPVFQWWREKLETLGQAVRVSGPQGVLEGIAEDVAPDGSLMLRLPDGRLLPLYSGEVTLRG